MKIIMLAILNKFKDITRPFRMRYARYKREVIDFNKLDSDQLRSVIRHEAHRVEKSYYNNIFLKKKSVYLEKVENIKSLERRLLKKNTKLVSCPDVRWAKDIAENAESLDENFINKTQVKPSSHQLSIENIQAVFENRRSAREWSDSQPKGEELMELSYRLINCAINMPCSGNRQAVRFLILQGNDEKMFLKGIKEKHCYEAPLLICVFSETKVYGSYGAFSKHEECVLIDAAAAAAAIVIAAELEGFSTCWNHFGLDLVESRAANKTIYRELRDHFFIRKNLRPVGVIAIGKEAYHAPKPERMSIEDYLI